MTHTVWVIWEGRGVIISVYCKFVPFFARVRYCSFSANQKPSFGSLTASDWLKIYSTLLVQKSAYIYSKEISSCQKILSTLDFEFQAFFTKVSTPGFLIICSLTTSFVSLLIFIRTFGWKILSTVFSDITCLNFPSKHQMSQLLAKRQSLQSNFEAETKNLKMKISVQKLKNNKMADSIKKKAAKITEIKQTNKNLAQKAAENSKMISEETEKRRKSELLYLFISNFRVMIISCVNPKSA